MIRARPPPLLLARRRPGESTGRASIGAAQPTAGDTINALVLYHGDYTLDKLQQNKGGAPALGGSSACPLYLAVPSSLPGRLPWLVRPRNVSQQALGTLAAPVGHITVSFLYIVGAAGMLTDCPAEARQALTLLQVRRLRRSFAARQSARGFLNCARERSAPRQPAPRSAARREFASRRCAGRRATPSRWRTGSSWRPSSTRRRQRCGASAATSCSWSRCDKRGRRRRAPEPRCRCVRRLRRLACVVIAGVARGAPVARGLPVRPRRPGAVGQPQPAPRPP